MKIFKKFMLVILGGLFAALLLGEYLGEGAFVVGPALAVLVVWKLM